MNKVWWQFWHVTYANALSSVSVRAGCTLLGHTEDDFSGRSVVVRAVGGQRDLDLMDAEYNSFNNNIESYECDCA